jgi:hypothetical protein
LHGKNTTFPENEQEMEDEMAVFLLKLAACRKNVVFLQ